jgi:beta-glucosidase-like glycosyl hydrolase/CubicO group peptidase (beta-lactamase class C family)
MQLKIDCGDITMKKFIFFLSLILFVLNFSYSNDKEKKKLTYYSYNNSLFFKPDQAAIKWVNTTYSSLTLDEKISQLIIPVTNAYYQSGNSKSYKGLVNLVKKKKVGGFIFSVGDVYSVAELANSLQKHAKIPLLISADYEKGGVAMRVDRSTYFPTNMAVGAANDSLLTFEMGKIIGKEGRALGVHQNYSPVVDVNNNPENPIINVRAFGEDPQLVARLGKALMHGLHAGGMVSCLKHFPGHGDTDVDSHSDLPILNFDRKRLEAIELFPFKSAIKDNAPSVMVSHLSVPVFDNEKNLPASLSYKVITELLKEEMKFNGLIVTDGMEMRGVTKNFSVAEATVKAIQAGHDLVVIPPNPEIAIKALRSAVKNGKISTKRLEHSVKKVLLMKYCLGLHKNKFVNTEEIPDLLNTVENNGVSKKLAQKSITLLKNESILPLQRNGKNKIVCITFSDNADASTGSIFERGFSSRYRNVEFLKIDTRTSDTDFEKIYSKAKGADVLILPLYLRVRSYSGTVGFSKEQKIYADTLQQLGKKMIVLSYGNPYIVSTFSDISAYLTSYGDAPVSIEAGLEALFGEISITGKLPINIPGFYKIGDGIYLKKESLQSSSLYDVDLKDDSFDTIDDLMDKAIEDSVFPGAVLLVSKEGKVFYNKAFGNFTYDEDSKPIQTSTIFDLASVSKAIGTTNAAMKLVEENRLNLDSSVSFYLYEFNSKGKDKILIKNLLQHDSGLPPFKLFYKMCKSPEEIMDSIYACEVLFSPGDSVLYSDIGMITLGKVIESITGKTLDVYLKEEYFSPLGLNSTMYKPDTKLSDFCAPTEVDDYWRMRTVQGTVHDENADALGGVAGHAGLFSNAGDLAIILQMLLNKGVYNGKRYLSPATIEMFLTRVKNTSRTLGWGIKPLKGSYSMGNKFSSNSFGHIGFTGTSVCVDPDRNLFIILLTNRVHPTRNNNKLSNFRQLIQDKIIECIENKNNILTYNK